MKKLEKKLFLTVAVASLAFSANSFAVSGKDKKGETIKTETEKRDDARKVKEAGTAGVSARSQQAKEIANQLLLKTRVVTGSDVKLAGDRLAAAVESGILKLSSLQTLEANSSNEVAINYTNLLSIAALKNKLVGEQGEALAKFGDIEIINNLNGKTQWTAEAIAKLNVTLIETLNSIQRGDNPKLADDLVAGLLKAGFTKERIKEILKECFKIAV
jgi:hypothetical protein